MGFPTTAMPPPPQKSFRSGCGEAAPSLISLPASQGGLLQPKGTSNRVLKRMRPHPASGGFEFRTKKYVSGRMRTPSASRGFEFCLRSSERVGPESPAKKLQWRRMHVFRRLSCVPRRLKGVVASSLMQAPSSTLFQ